MIKHRTGTRQEWLKARMELLKAEKDLTRRSDELARKRQELPWVKIDKEYGFATDEGKSSLVDLFRGRSQMLVYHFMFGPDYKAGANGVKHLTFGGRTWRRYPLNCAADKPHAPYRSWRAFI